MALVDDLIADGEDIDLGKVEKNMSNNGLPAEGWHHAVLVGCKKGQANSGTEFRELVFKILAGDSVGREVKESLFLSPKTKDRQLLFMMRLGVVGRKEVGGKTVATRIAGREDFTDVLGAQCLIEVKHEEYTKTDGKKGTKAILSFGGLAEVADPKHKGVPKGTAPANVSSASGHAQEKPKDSLDDLDL